MRPVSLNRGTVLFSRCFLILRNSSKTFSRRICGFLEFFEVGSCVFSKETRFLMGNCSRGFGELFLRFGGRGKELWMVH
jgi:hypothetical protein